MHLAALIFFAAAVAAPEAPCRAHENGAALDFWVGDWRVTSMDGATEFGANRIEAALGGCAIFEHWTGATGGEGKSLFAFDARSGVWDQTWVTGDTSRPGGLKRKRLTEYVEDGVRFEGEIAADDGAYLDRTTLTARADGSVRQLIEISTDGGATWRVTFDALYVRKN